MMCVGRAPLPGRRFSPAPFLFFPAGVSSGAPVVFPPSCASSPSVLSSRCYALLRAPPAAHFSVASCPRARCPATRIVVPPSCPASPPRPRCYPVSPLRAAHRSLGTSPFSCACPAVSSRRMFQLPFFGVPPHRLVYPHSLRGSVKVHLRFPRSVSTVKVLEMRFSCDAGDPGLPLCREALPLASSSAVSERDSPDGIPRRSMFGQALTC